jgi:transitional endoplasmic reticulum ATPase
MADFDLPRAQDLPTWMGSLRDRYLQTDTSQFILHGNVHDFVLCDGKAWNMTDFVDAFFSPSGKLVVHYDPGRGIWFSTQEDAVRAARSMVESNFVSATKVAPHGIDRTPKRLIAENLMEQLGGERSPEIALEALEALLTDPEIQVAAVIHYAELIAPDGGAANLSFHDRTASARLHRWSLSADIVGGGNLVLMLTGALSDLSRRVTRNPRVGALHVQLPNEVARGHYIAHIKPDLVDESAALLTRVTAGLQLRQMQDLIAPHQSKSVTMTKDTDESIAEPVELPIAEIMARKKEILEQECFGLIEVIDPGHGFDVVGGMEPIKNVLNRVAQHVISGRRKQVPMGIMFVGPMGTGKSFLGEAFAKESGLSAIRLKNFRDKWVGSTEANLEKVLNIVEALGEILVMIDEGDRSMGGGADNDGGVSSRVMARLKEFMSDTSHRGRIVFVMMTNRPDKLDTDMKRPGRFDLKIPFFPPQSSEARLAITKALLRRHKIDCAATDKELIKTLDTLEGYAAADLEAVILLAYDDLQSEILPEGVTEVPESLTAAFIARAALDFMPTRETTMIEYMELMAVYEASNRRLLPEQFRDIEVADLNSRIAEVRSALRHQKLSL